MSLGGRILLVFLPFAAGYFLSYWFRTINALISGTLAGEFDLSATQLGFLTSVYFLSAVVQLPLGALIDSYGPRRVQSILLLVAAAGAALFAVGDGFWVLLVGRALIGVGAGAVVISGFKAIVLWFPRERLALMNGWFVMLGALGAVTATAPAEFIISAIGWRETFEMLAVTTAVCGAAMWYLVPETGPRASEPVPASKALHSPLKDHRFWRLAPLSTMCISTAWALQGLWVGLWLRDVEQLDHQTVVRHLFVMASALCAGSLILGLCAHRLRRQGIRATDVFSVAAAIFISAEVALIVGLPISSYLLWAIVASLGAASVLTYAILAEYFPVDIIGKANAALSTCHIGGAFALQYAMGFIIDRWASVGGHYPPDAHRTALGTVVVLQIAALAWFARADRAFARRIAHGAAARSAPRHERGKSMNQGRAPATDVAREVEIGFFRAFLAAMHESRRDQAAREIHQYRHLIEGAQASDNRGAAARRRAVSREELAMPRQRADDAIAARISAQPATHWERFAMRTQAALRIAARSLLVFIR